MHSDSKCGSTGLFAALALTATAAFVGGCAPPPPVPPPYALLDADPAPSKDGSVPGAATTDLDKGIAYLENEAYEKAIAHLESAIVASPENAAAHLYLGLARERTGDPAEAEKEYRRAIEIDPDMVPARVYLGALYLEKPERPDEAIEVLAPAVKKEPEAIDLRLNLAYAYRLSNRPAAAVPHYRKALEVEDNPEVRFMLADVLYESESFDAMIVELRKLLPHVEKDVQSLSVIGLRLAKAKAYDECITTFTTAVRLKPTDPDLYVHRGLCRHKRKLEQEARADFIKAVDIDKRHQAAWYYLGMSYLKDKMRGKAADAFQAAMKLGIDTPLGKLAKERFDAMAKQSK